MAPPRSIYPRLILTGSAAAILASTGMAVENLWTGLTNKDWNTASNWSLGRGPTNQNGATTGDTFDGAVLNVLTNLPVITTDLSATARDFVLGGGSGTNGR